MNEGAHETISKTINFITQIPVRCETDDIIINLTDSKNIHICEFNGNYFELYFDMEIDLFQGNFPLLPTNARPEELIGDPTISAEAWTDLKS
jgi:hypothetical protein